MFPRQGLSSFLLKLSGESVFLDALQRNVLAHLTKVRKGRTHTFLSNNAQTVEGISQNTGAERYYTWANTLVDCRLAPNLSDAALKGFLQAMEANSGFEAFKSAIESRSGGFLHVTAFLHVLKGQDNKRYNIRLNGKCKYEEFDTIRVGVCLKAQSAENFKMGLYHVLDWEKRNHPDYRGLLIIPDKAPA